jgi:hypothetical protein
MWLIMHVIMIDRKEKRASTSHCGVHGGVHGDVRGDARVDAHDDVLGIDQDIRIELYQYGPHTSVSTPEQFFFSLLCSLSISTYDR